MLFALTVATCIAGLGYMLTNPASKPNTSKIAKHHELNKLKGDGLIISENVRLSKKYSNEHALIVMPSGAGKTRRVAMPNVRSLTFVSKNSPIFYKWEMNC